MTIWNTETLQEFKHQKYKDLLTRQHVVSNEQSKVITKRELHGYILERENTKTKLKDRFFVRTEDVHMLPIEILEYKKVSYRSEVFKVVNKSKSCKIPSRDEMTFRQMVDYYAAYDHESEYHWKLSRIIVLAAYVERLNIRIVSEASFGKDALVDILNILNGNVSNLYNATLAKMKYALNNDLIVINELGGLKKEDVVNLQVYLTQAGAYKHEYENNSRSFAGVKEVIPLQGKSHIIFHNTPEYYNKKGQMFFEQMFTKAVMDRFPALLFKGWVQEDFSRAKPLSEFGEADIDKLKSFIASLNWYKENQIQKSKYEIGDGFWGFKGRELQRSLRSFKIITKYVAEYARSEPEFLELCEILKQSRFDYLKSVRDAL